MAQKVIEGGEVTCKTLCVTLRWLKIRTIFASNTYFSSNFEYKVIGSDNIYKYQTLYDEKSKYVECSIKELTLCYQNIKYLDHFNPLNNVPVIHNKE